MVICRRFNAGTIIIAIKDKNSFMNNINIPLELSYRDVFLKPQKCIVHSRSECDTSVKLGNFTFDLPVYPANMKSVVSIDTCKYLAQRNCFYTMHRFGIDPVSFTVFMHQHGLISSISVGVKEESILQIEKLSNMYCPPEFITIDIANAWTERIKNLIYKIKNILPTSFLIVGNVASSEACKELESWGADAIKVGISGGAACITKLKTGFYRPMMSTLMDCWDSVKVPIIADGGIENHGDIAKALTCASMVMAGSLFSGYDESAGEIVNHNGKFYKEYFGSASEFNKEERKNIEGKKLLVEYKGSMDNLLRELKEDLQSSISYASGKDLSVFSPHLLLRT